jgi:nucleotide-binding universal stress UspA family protein
MNKLLIATDGSPAARAAVETGIRLGEEQRAEVVFVHVVEAEDVVVPRFGSITAIPHDLGSPEEDEALAHAAELARERGVPYTVRLVSGFDVETILGTADEVDAELIVIGSNRHGALGTALLGSVSMALLRRATRPVVVVHPTPVPAAVGG